MHILIYVSGTDLLTTVFIKDICVGYKCFLIRLKDTGKSARPVEIPNGSIGSEPLRFLCSWN